MHRPTVLDNQQWPDKKPRRSIRPGMMLFVLILGVNAGLIAFNISLGQIEAKIGFRADQGTGARKFTYLPVQSSQKVREARISRSPDEESLASTPDTFRLSGGYLEGKEVRTLHLTVQSSLTFSVCRIVSEDQCRGLAVRIARQLSWFLDVDREIRKGDKVALIYQSLPAGPELKILKLDYVSGFLHKTLAMNFFKTAEMNYGSYFDNRGNEMISRLDSRSSPIRNYSEITALPGEHRRGSGTGHAGTDFKAEVGTPVYSSFAGRVTRANWNTKRNGYCIEIDHPDKGVKTLYLHLDRVLVRPGQWVGQGMQIGLSGNTGRSYAPHLHYEIKSRDRKKTVYNPFLFKYHKKYSRTISNRHRKEFDKVIRLYDSLLTAG
ncbi:MAG: M23 family metallopeptidase [Nitrospina sp.]|nr:MAG: M23 family metallopeptidase [Nitrospina sp.]